MKMAKGKKANPKSQAKNPNQEKQLKEKLRMAAKSLADLKKEFKSKLADAQKLGFGQGFSAAMKQINQKVKAKVKAVVNLEHGLEREFDKLASANLPKKAAKKPSASKGKRVVKLTKKSALRPRKSLKRAAATKKVNAPAVAPVESGSAPAAE